MKRTFVLVPLLAVAVCTVAIAEPRTGLFRNASLSVAEESTSPVSLVSFFHGYRGGGGYGPSCGAAAPSCGIEPSCGIAAPTCGAEPTCAADPSCGCEDVCAPRCRKWHFGHFLHKHRRCGNACEVSCGCEVSAPSCGCDSAPACCGRRAHFGHRLCGGHCDFGGCSYGCGHGCGHRCGHVCKPHRFWANGWCGEVCDGYCGGNPPDCSGGSYAPAIDKGAPIPEYAPMPEVGPPMGEPEPAEAKSTRRLIVPRFTSKAIGAGIQ